MSTFYLQNKQHHKHKVLCFVCCSLAGRPQYVNVKALVNVTEIIVVIIHFTLTLCVCSAQDCSLQAQSNLTFLSILKEPCEELEQLKPSQIASKFKHIVSLIRIIWINSPHYNTSERIVNFFRQVPEMLNSRQISTLDLNQCPFHDTVHFMDFILTGQCSLT